MGESEPWGLGWGRSLGAFDLVNRLPATYSAESSTHATLRVIRLAERGDRRFGRRRHTYDKEE